MKLIDRKYIFADVKDTEYVNYGKFRIDLPDLPTDKNVIHRLFLKKVVMPYNWKASIGNTFTHYDPTHGTTVHTFPDGNYSILTLLETMTPWFPNDFVVTFNQITSRLVFTNNGNNPNHDVNISTTAWKMLGFANSSSVFIEHGTTWTTPYPIDLRPIPIIEIRTDCTTAGQEIRNIGGEVEVSDTTILCAIAMDVPVFSHKIWLDDGGSYFATLVNQYRSVHFTITDTDGNPIVPQSSPYFVIGIDSYRDDEAELLSTQMESLKLQRYNMLLKSDKKTPLVKKNVITR